MTRLDKLVYMLIRCCVGAAAALTLLAACAGKPEAQAVQAGAEPTVGQGYHTDYDEIYDELADA